MRLLHVPLSVRLTNDVPASPEGGNWEPHWQVLHEVSQYCSCVTWFMLHGMSIILLPLQIIYRRESQSSSHFPRLVLVLDSDWLHLWKAPRPHDSHASNDRKCKVAPVFS
jgi:hypothetical protein